jgi:hypothetical protein
VPGMSFPFDPSPSTLWTLHLDGKVATCQLQFVPNGNQVQMFRNESLLMSRIIESGEGALAWAEEERQRMLGHDWSLA